MASFDQRHIRRIAITVNGRSGQQQIIQQRLAVLIQCGQGHRIQEVHRVGGNQFQGFQCRSAATVITLEQAIHDLLIECQAGRQGVARRCRRQRFGTANIESAHTQAQMAGTVSNSLVQLEIIVGNKGNAAFGIQLGGAAAVSG